jgi:hypothetical protein
VRAVRPKADNIRHVGLGCYKTKGEATSIINFLAYSGYLKVARKTRVSRMIISFMSLFKLGNLSILGYFV